MSVRLVLLGPPGAGKGTFTGIFASRMNLVHWSTGDLLREEAQLKKPHSDEVKRYLDAGELVPDDLVVELLRERMTPDRSWERGFVLDGFPRTVGQARQFDEALRQWGVRLSVALNFVVPVPVIIDRLSGRWICPSDGETYHLRNRPPKVSGRCDICGRTLAQRDDDREETVRRRLEVFREESLPVIEYYRRQNVLVDVAGDGSVQDTYSRIVDMLHRRGVVSAREREALTAVAP